MDTIPGVGIAEEAVAPSAHRRAARDAVTLPAVARRATPQGNGAVAASSAVASSAAGVSSAVASSAVSSAAGAVPATIRAVAPVAPVPFADAPWWPENRPAHRRPAVVIGALAAAVAALALGLSRKQETGSSGSAAIQVPTASSRVMASASAPRPPSPATEDTQIKKADPSPAASSGSGEGIVSVHLMVYPKGTRVFADGKEVGKSPLTLSVRPGETQVFEARAQGFLPRKMTIDGSRTEQVFWMVPLPTKGQGAKAAE